MTESSPKKVYITMLGRSVWAVLNSYHAVLREKEFFPDEIVLFAEGKASEKLLKEIDATVRGLAILSEEFHISPAIKYEVISESECEISFDADFVKMVQHILGLIKKRKKDGDVIAIDITPGKKTLVAGTLLPINLSDVDHIFYLSIKETVPRPYMMIPYQIQQLNDFKEQVVRAMNGQ
ncbi:hypothetical protein [Methanolobus psychrotolerans]|uniref:hypothetical protein n=1 Tax=Methanolobus psychrotolerans TaxID=1874706 RepID=UPI000B917631|nr:hypothetical protein [Methanolobus psychrotolerans]